MPSSLWKCNVCGSVHETEEYAAYCEESGRPSPRFAIGDTVYVSDKSSKAVATPRRVLAIEPSGHGYAYALDFPFEGANGMLFGVLGPKSGKYAGMAREEQLMMLGDDVSVGGKTITLTIDMVKQD